MKKLPYILLSGVGALSAIMALFGLLHLDFLNVIYLLGLSIVCFLFAAVFE